MFYIMFFLAFYQLMPVDDVGCTEEDAKWQRKHRALWHSQQGKCRQDFCKWVLLTECMFLYFCLLASSCWLVRSCVLFVRNRTRFLVRCALNLAACKQELDKFDEVQQYVGRNTALHYSWVSEFAQMKWGSEAECFRRSSAGPRILSAWQAVPLRTIEQIDLDMSPAHLFPETASSWSWSTPIVITMALLVITETLNR